MHLGKSPDYLIEYHFINSAMPKANETDSSSTLEEEHSEQTMVLKPMFAPTSSGERPMTS
jgi:hypothetical protein